MFIREVDNAINLYQANNKYNKASNIPPVNQVNERNETSKKYDKTDFKSKSDDDRITKLNEKIEAQRVEQEKQKKELERLRAELDASNKQVESMKEAFDVLIKCLKISSNIISGNEVSHLDHKFLMDNDPELYMMSISVSIKNDDPKRVKQISEDQDKNNTSGSINDSSENFSEISFKGGESNAESSPAHKGSQPAEIRAIN